MNRKLLKVETPSFHHHANCQKLVGSSCLMCNDVGLTTPTPSTCIQVEQRFFHLPSEMWQIIFSFQDLYTLSVCMLVQRKWIKLYRERGFETKIQFMRMMIMEMVIARNYALSNQHSRRKVLNATVQCAYSGSFGICLNAASHGTTTGQQTLNKQKRPLSPTHNPDYNDLTRLAKMLDLLKEYTTEDIAQFAKEQQRKSPEKVFSVFELIKDLFKQPTTNRFPKVSSQQRSEQRTPKDPLSRIAIVGDVSMSKTTFFTSYRMQKEDFSNEVNCCLDDKVTLHVPSSKHQQYSSYQIWDSYTSMDVTTMQPWFLRKINFLILMFDVSKPASFSKIKEWVLQAIFNDVLNSDNLEFILVGSKHDMLQPKQITTYEQDRRQLYQPFADSLGIPFVEINSTNPGHVNTIIQYALCWSYHAQQLQIPISANTTPSVSQKNFSKPNFSNPKIITIGC